VGVCVHIHTRADCDAGIGMMAMVMVVMMIVLMMVIIVPEALRQVDAVNQLACQTIHKLTDLHRPKASCGQLNCPRSYISQAQLSSIAQSCKLQAGSRGGYKGGFQAGYQAAFSVGSDKALNFCQQALQWTPYGYNSQVVNRSIHPTLATSLM